MRHTHKGFDIRPAPKKAPGGGWGLSFTIEVKEDATTRSVRFSTNDTYKTKKEAEAACVKHAKSLINKKDPRVTGRDTSVRNEGGWPEI